MAKPETHPFYEVAALDPRLELIATDAGVVRLRDAVSGLWIVIASEEGSILDRWSDSDGAPFLRLDAHTVLDGAQTIADAIANARLTAQWASPMFEVFDSEAEYRAARAAEHASDTSPEGDEQ